nr:MAG TPA: YopX protein [Caudoviricetes sp.]
MREIKFRAWYKPYKQMCQVESLRFDGNGVYTAVLIEEPFYDRKLVKADEIAIEQFTGLKDMNGTDIYEGDIVSLRLWGSNGYEYENGIVRYYPPSAAFKWFSLEDDENDCNNYWLQHADSDGREVVGNIHENPELVEEK